MKTISIVIERVLLVQMVEKPEEVVGVIKLSSFSFYLKIQLLIVLEFLTNDVCAQQVINPDKVIQDVANFGKKDTDQKGIEVDFMLNYYSQEGNHSAVTGGVGTEKLNDRAMKIVVTIPLDSVSILQISNHTSVYTSASTDNIDTNVSSASRHDLRDQFDINFTRESGIKNESISYLFGGSTESDYMSIFAGLSYGKSYNNENSRFSLGLTGYFDTWLLIFPEELRNVNSTAQVVTNRRRSINLSIDYQQVISRRLQASLSSQFVYQSGLLSTPFHRVYFEDFNGSGLELLPASRIKFPLGVRLNYYANDWLITRFFYRWYVDSFGIIANTLNLEIPIRTSPFFSFYPFIRWHSQVGSRYFKPFGRHVSDSRFRTSDYDLSGFNSTSYGFGFHWAPLNGVGRLKILSDDKITLLKSIDLRGSIYSRSDGLSAWMTSVNFSFYLDR